VLVVYDALGVTADRSPPFVRNFMTVQGSIEGAMAAFVAAVRDGSFSGPEHCY
jgi:3-methyl-2-oxobutanoate hydroxymethyltransferase